MATAKAATTPTRPPPTDFPPRLNHQPKPYWRTSQKMLGLSLGLAVIGVSLGLGLIGYSAMQGMSRQPEAIGKMQTAMLIAMAFVELVFLLTVFVGAGSFK